MSVKKDIKTIGPGIIGWREEAAEGGDGWQDLHLTLKLMAERSVFRRNIILDAHGVFFVRIL